MTGGEKLLDKLGAVLRKSASAAKSTIGLVKRVLP
jgi:hypothetical protein